MLGSGAGAGVTKTPFSFVIPKNKILGNKGTQTSGALVPVSAPVSRWEPIEPQKPAESLLQPTTPPRNTSWGPDPLENNVVRGGRLLALQTRIEQINQQLEMGMLDIDSNEVTRSPSPPPIYGDNGQRLNTREGRKREQLELEKRESIGECIHLNPNFKPPAGYKPLVKDAKLFLPVKYYPGYNFIGLILGPRGNTQKRMEQETGAKIAIRGKGAVKEGKLNRKDGKFAEGANEELHVYICGDTVEKVDAAVDLIQPLLTPVDETRNSHKRKQLMELAKMNGTVRDFPLLCNQCGEAGHREWQCPKEKLLTFNANVKCGYCGDGGHPTADCPLKQSGIEVKGMDQEYESFLSELGEGLSGAGGAAVPTRPPPPSPFANQGPPPGMPPEHPAGQPPPVWAMQVASSMSRASGMASEEDIARYANEENAGAPPWHSLPEERGGTWMPLGPPIDSPRGPLTGYAAPHTHYPGPQRPPPPYGAPLPGQHQVRPPAVEVMGDMGGRAPPPPQPPALQMRPSQQPPLPPTPPPWSASPPQGPMFGYQQHVPPGNHSGFRGAEFGHQGAPEQRTILPPPNFNSPPQYHPPPPQGGGYLGGQFRPPPGRGMRNEGHPNFYNSDAGGRGNMAPPWGPPQMQPQLGGMSQGMGGGQGMGMMRSQWQDHGPPPHQMMGPPRGMHQNFRPPPPQMNNGSSDMREAEYDSFMESMGVM